MSQALRATSRGAPLSMPFTEDAFRATPFADVVALSGDAPLPQRSLLDTILASLDDAKAEDVVDIDVAAKTPIADHMVVCTGRSTRHVGAIADHLVKDLKDAGFGAVAVEGQPACDWVLIDAGSIIVHVFRPEVREFYHLEKIWAPDPEPVTGLR
jgi:ribosome-associated protein